MLRYTLLVFLPIAGLIVGAAVGIYLYQQANPITSSDVALNTNATANADETNINTSDTNSVLVEEEGAANTNTAAVGANDLAVDWLSDPVGVDSASLGFKIVDTAKDLPSNATVSQIYNVLHVGTVSGGVFDGERVLLIERTNYPFTTSHYRVIDDTKSGKLIFLKDLSNVMDPDDSSFFTVDNTYDVPDLHLPETFAVTYEKSALTLKAEKASPAVLFTTFIASPTNKAKLAPVTSEAYGDLYEYATSGIFVLKMADHTTKSYRPDYPFVLEDAKSGDGDTISASNLTLTWNDGTTTSGTYSPLEVLPCPAPRYRIRPDLEDSRLAKGGTFSNGDDFYEPVSQTDALYKSAYEYLATTKLKISQSAFAADHPLVYWKDSFGRWMELLQTKYYPSLGSDCGYGRDVL